MRASQVGRLELVRATGSLAVRRHKSARAWPQEEAEGRFQMPRAVLSSQHWSWEQQPQARIRERAGRSARGRYRCRTRLYICQKRTSHTRAETVSVALGGTNGLSRMSHWQSFYVAVRDRKNKKSSLTSAQRSKLRRYANVALYMGAKTLIMKIATSIDLSVGWP